MYKLDGNDGTICNVISLPNSSEGSLGQLDHYTVSVGGGVQTEMLYVSNFDDGLIYAVIPGCPGSVYSTFDHGVDGRPQETDDSGNPLVPIADKVNEKFTPLGRRIWGLRINEPEHRLYYAVWNVESPFEDLDEDNEIWSVAIDPITGDFVPNSATREFKIPAFPGWNDPGPLEFPVADIAFECGNRMMLSQRGVHYDPVDDVIKDEWPGPHEGNLLEYTGTHLAWVASPVTKFRVGNYGNGTNAVGGVDFDSNGNVVATSNALQNQNPDTIYGFAIIPSTGSNPVLPYTQNQFLIDVNCTPDITGDKTQVFDVECYRPQSNNCAATCAIENPIIECGSATTSDEFTLTFDVVNNSGFDVTKLVIPGLIGGVSVSPNIIDVNLPNNDTLTGVQLVLNGGNAGDIVCIPVGLMATDDTGELFECCGTEVCVELPACCMDITDESITVNAANGDAEYTFTVTNLGGLAPTVAGHLFMSVVSPPGVTISNEWQDLGTLNDNDSITLSTIISGAQPGAEICFQITMHDATLNECCGIVHCITIPGGGTGPCLDIEICSIMEDIDNDGVEDLYLAWTSTGLECCQKLYLYHNGNFYMWVDITLGEAEIPSSLGGLQDMLGDWCFQCADDPGVNLSCCAVGLTAPPPEFLRGDANSDGAFDISDVISSLDYLFQGQSVPCLVALDSNDDETVDIGDTIFSLEALFGGGPSPWPPYQQCGVDETSGNLGCEYFPACEGNDSGPQGD